MAETKVWGWKVHYHEAGSGTPVLLLHGIPTSSFLWRRQLNALSGGHRAIALDLLGWGRSEKPKDFDYNLESYAEFLLDFLEGMQVEKTSLVVHDLGGPIGLTMLEKCPDRVSKLVILDTFTFLPPLRKLGWKLLCKAQTIHNLAWDLGLRKTDLFASSAFHDKNLLTPKLVGKYRKLNRGSCSTDYRILDINGVEGLCDAVERVSPKIKIPTLIVWAEGDIIFPPSSAKKLHEKIDESILKVIPRCGHWIQEERPTELNECLVGFLSPTRTVRKDSNSRSRTRPEG